MKREMKAEHEDLCLQPLGAQECTCEAIRQRRGSDNPWGDIMVTAHMEFEERAHEHGQSLAAQRVEAESLGHSQDCAMWIWAGRGLPCDCGLESGTIKGELIREDGEPT